MLIESDTLTDQRNMTYLETLNLSSENPEQEKQCRNQTYSQYTASCSKAYLPTCNVQCPVRRRNCIAAAHICLCVYFHACAVNPWGTKQYLLLWHKRLQTCTLGSCDVRLSLDHNWSTTGSARVCNYHDYAFAAHGGLLPDACSITCECTQQHAGL